MTLLDCNGKVIFKEVIFIIFFNDLSGIQQTVRVLEYTLKNLFVYRDSKDNLNRLQRPYKEQPKRVINFIFFNFIFLHVFSLALA